MNRSGRCLAEGLAAGAGAWRATHLIGILLGTTLLAASPAAAQDATWNLNPGSGDFNSGANWTPATAPNGTATFGASNTTNLTFSANTTVGGLTFSAGAPAYTFTMPGNTVVALGNILTIDGAGVINNSAHAPTINIGIPNAGGQLWFTNASTAGNALINNDGELRFLGSSTAANATIITNIGGVRFEVTSTAGNATITNNGDHLIFDESATAASAVITNSTLMGFQIFATAGNARITNNGDLFFNYETTAGSATITNIAGGTANFSQRSTAGSATITNNATAILNFADTSTAGSANITNAGSLQFLNSSTAGSADIANNLGGTLNFADGSTAGSATITNAGSLQFLNSSTAGSAGIANNLGATLNFVDTATAGTATIANDGFLGFTGTSTAGGATITNTNNLEFDNGSTAGSARITNNNVLAFFATSTAGSASITTNSGGSSFIADSASGGTARFILNGTGLLDISGLTTGGTTAGSIEGDGSVFLGSKNLAVGGNNLSTTFSGVIRDGGSVGGTGGSLTKTGTGTLTLSGANTYTGATTVDDGTLAVNGSIATSSPLTVNAGGTLGGSGTVGNTVVNGGTLAPGNSIGTLTVSGSLTLTAASTYLVQVSGTSADKTAVTGIATLAGTVVVDPLTRLTATTTYTILTSAGTTGTFSSATVNSPGFARNAQLSYSGGNVFLTLDPGLLSPILPGAATINQSNVATGIDNALLAGGSLPAGFNALFALSGNGLLNALTQASGETATGSQQATFDAMNMFMGVLTDPFIAGRGDGVSSSTGAPQFAGDDGASAYADNGKPRSKSERDAYAAIYRKAPPLPETFTGRWSVWAAGYGGSQTTDGNAALGSNSATSRIFGTAVGADYRFSPFTLAGFALAGGGTNFNVNGLGSGRSDLFQAGAFIRHTVGPAYISSALAYGWQDITTDRTVTIAGIDRLRAQFNANAFSGRVEGGYRFVTPWMNGIGLTPYAAGQFTTFDLPAYAEQVLSGANTFALAYGSKSVTATRSELGLRLDKSFAMQNAILTLRGRAAWAHDFNPDRAVGATFQTLPGASFVVNGAQQASDAALTTASAELKWINGWSAAATFEGEFSNVTRSYAGKGMVRYAW